MKELAFIQNPLDKNTPNIKEMFKTIVIIFSFDRFCTNVIVEGTTS